MAEPPPPLALYHTFFACFPKKMKTGTDSPREKIGACGMDGSNIIRVWVEEKHNAVDEPTDAEQAHGK